MTLDEAIKHYEEKAEELRKDADYLDAPYGKGTSARTDCLECAKEHEQLAEWLKELRKLKKCRECPLIKEECSLCGFVEQKEDTKDVRHTCGYCKYSDNIGEAGSNICNECVESNRGKKLADWKFPKWEYAEDWEKKFEESNKYYGTPDRAIDTWS